MRDRGRPRFKFEIISEGRISLAGETIEPFPVEVLDRTSCIAEKLLAHADRGRDESTHARDLIDLAFMAVSGAATILGRGGACTRGGLFLLRAHEASVRFQLAELQRQIRHRGQQDPAGGVVRQVAA